MNRKYDWKSVENCFIGAGFESRTSLKEISVRFNIPYQSVRRYAAAHNWHSKRYRAWIEKKHGMSFEEYLQTLYQEVMDR